MKAQIEPEGTCFLGTSSLFINWAQPYLRLLRMLVECLLLVFRENLPVQVDIQSALNYTAILPNINLVGSEFDLTTKYEFSGNSV